MDKRRKRKDSLRNLWDIVKRSNIRIMGVPEEDKKKWHEKIFEVITVKNLPKIGKEIAT